MAPIPVVPPGGYHLLLDLYDAKYLDDVNYVQNICRDAARATGATLLFDHFHHFGDGYGVTGVVLLGESHLSIHTWPETGFASIDVFVCGACEPAEAVPVLLDAFCSRSSVQRLVRRGNPA